MLTVSRYCLQLSPWPLSEPLPQSKISLHALCAALRVLATVLYCCLNVEFRGCLTFYSGTKSIMARGVCCLESPQSVSQYMWKLQSCGSALVTDDATQWSVLNLNLLHITQRTAERLLWRTQNGQTLGNVFLFAIRLLIQYNQCDHHEPYAFIVSNHE